MSARPTGPARVRPRFGTSLQRSPGRLLVGLLALLVAGCLPTPATSEARGVAWLYQVFMGAAAVVAVIVVGLGAGAVIRYRGRRDELPPQAHGDVRLEIVWTSVPALLVLGLFVATVIVLAATDEVDESIPPGAEVSAVAFRWGWRFEYPDDHVVVEGYGLPGPEVVVPVGEPIRLSLTGEDVVHAFFVPRFLLKRDMIPGRVNVVQFTVEETGTYRGQCAEFCGVYHSRMPFSIRAVERSEYEAWITDRRDRPPTLATPMPSAGA